MAFAVNVGMDIHLGDADAALAQFTLVQLDGAGTGTVTQSGAGESGFPIQEPAAVAGDPVTARYGGISKVTTGAAVTEGDSLASDAAGLAVAAVAGDVIIGYALQTAAGANIEIPIIVAGSGATEAVS